MAGGSGRKVAYMSNTKSQVLERTGKINPTEMLDINDINLRLSENLDLQNNI
jgi:hypothetical protein